MMDKTHTIKHAVKGPKIYEVKLFINDKKDLIFRKKHTCIPNNNYHTKKQQTLDYRFLAWDRHIKYVAGLNMFVSPQPSP